MKTIRAGIAAVVVGAALAACGSPVAGIPSAVPGAAAATSATSPTGSAAARSPQVAPAPTAAPTGVPAGKEAAVEAAFRGYYQALLTRDWTTACAYAAPATIAKLVQNVRANGGAVTTCEEAFAAIYANAAAAAAADGIAGSAQVEDITVSADTATIRWSALLNGQRSSLTNQLTRIGGTWLLLDTGA